MVGHHLATARRTLLGALALTLPLVGLAWLARPVYPFIEDDSLISLRYARRLLEGHGLTWTDGDAVEGYSNLLWVLLTASLGALGLDLIFAARLLGVLSTAGAVWALLRLFPVTGPGGPLPALVGAGYLCLSGSAALWAIAGLEQPLVLCLLAWTLVGLQPLLRGGQAPTGPLRAALPAALPLAALVWTRPDSPLFVVLCAPLLLAFGPGTLRARVGLTALVTAIPFGAFLLQLAFRVLYYGDVLPNTAYIKATVRDTRLRGGIAYLGAGLRHMYPLVAVAVPGLLVGTSLRRSRPFVLLVVTWLVGWLAYVAIIGGDHFPGHRHLLPAIGLLAVLVAQGLSALFRARRLLGALAAMAFLGILAPFAEMQRHDPDYLMGQQARWQWDGEAVGELFGRPFAGVPQARRPLWAVTAAGCLPYFSQLRALDMLGLNDRHIARQPPDLRLPLAHEHGDGDYVLRRAPDLITFGLPTGDHPGYLSGMQMRRDRRFRERYRVAYFAALSPHYVANMSYVRVDGMFGVQRREGRVAHPAHLLRSHHGAPVRGTTLPDGTLGAWLPSHAAMVGVPMVLGPGQWKLLLEPHNPRVEVTVVVEEGALSADTPSGSLWVGSDGATVRFRVRVPGPRVPLRDLVFERQPEVAALPATARRLDGVRKRRALLTRARGASTGPSRGRVLADFDGGMPRWALTGRALHVSAGPVRGQQPLRGHQGKALNSFTPWRGDRARGTLRSPTWEIPTDAVLGMRVGGTRAVAFHRQVGVSVEIDGQRVLVMHGDDSGRLRLQEVDLSHYAGRNLSLLVFDDSAFGHVLLDDVTLR